MFLAVLFRPVANRKATASASAPNFMTASVLLAEAATTAAIVPKPNPTGIDQFSAEPMSTSGWFSASLHCVSKVDIADDERCRVQNQLADLNGGRENHVQDHARALLASMTLGELDHILEFTNVGTLRTIERTRLLTDDV
jgi:secreted trypsin-like serine protease